MYSRKKEKINNEVGGLLLDLSLYNSSVLEKVINNTISVLIFLMCVKRFVKEEEEEKKC